MAVVIATYSLTQNVCVFCIGLIKLMERREDLLAAVVSPSCLSRQLSAPFSVVQWAICACLPFLT